MLSSHKCMTVVLHGITLIIRYTTWLCDLLHVVLHGHDNYYITKYEHHYDSRAIRFPSLRQQHEQVPTCSLNMCIHIYIYIYIYIYMYIYTHHTGDIVYAYIHMYKYT